MGVLNGTTPYRLTPSQTLIMKHGAPLLFMCAVVFHIAAGETYDSLKWYRMDEAASVLYFALDAGAFLFCYASMRVLTEKLWWSYYVLIWFGYIVLNYILDHIIGNQFIKEWGDNTSLLLFTVCFYHRFFIDFFNFNLLMLPKKIYVWLTHTENNSIGR